MASILDTLLAHLDACNTAQVEAAAQASRVPYHTVAKIKRRDTLNPRIATVQRLLTYFDEARPRKPARKAKPTAHGEAHEAALICRVAGVNPMASEGERK